MYEICSKLPKRHKNDAIDSCELLTYFTHCSGALIANFEQAKTSCGES